MILDRDGGDCSSAVMFTVENQGSRDLQVSAVTLSAGDVADFDLGATGLAAAVGPHATGTFTICFDPIAEPAHKTATVTITSDDVEHGTHYRRKPSVSKRLRERREGQPVELIDYADRAMNRLHQKYIKIVVRGKTKQTAVTAVARELAGFVWGTMTGKISYSLSGNSGARSLGVRRAAELCRAILCAVVLVSVPRWYTAGLVALRPWFR